MVIIGRHRINPLAGAQHFIIGLRVEAIQPVMLTAVVIDFHRPQPAQILIILIGLQRPVRMIIAAKETLCLHQLNIAVDVLRITITF